MSKKPTITELEQRLENMAFYISSNATMDMKQWSQLLSRYHATGIRLNIMRGEPVCVAHYQSEYINK